MQRSLDKAIAMFLHVVGGLLVILGLVHLAATPHIPALLNGSSREVYQRSVGPMLLNHVLVGILLLPLGYTTWLGAAAATRGEQWARRVLIVNAAVLLALPVSIAALMRQPEYFAAPLFVAGVVLVAVISLLMIMAIWLLARAPRAARH
jgi:hypothetical protein